MTLVEASAVTDLRSVRNVQKEAQARLLQTWHLSQTSDSNNNKHSMRQHRQSIVR